VISVSDAILREIVAHAQSDPDAEVCGLLAGTKANAEIVYRMQNVAKRPRVEFEPDGKDLLRALNDIDDRGIELFGFYHSHVDSSPYPSRTDAIQWNPEGYPDVVHLICSLEDPAGAVLRAFRFDKHNHLMEEPIQVIWGRQGL
jgi:proteasome lid subunit RPN8/RPN11